MAQAAPSPIATFRIGLTTGLRLDELLRANVGRFSIDELIELAIRAGLDVRLWAQEGIRDSKPCWAVSHLMTTASKQRLQSTASRITADQLAAIWNQIALAVGIDG